MKASTVSGFKYLRGEDRNLSPAATLARRKSKRPTPAQDKLVRFVRDNSPATIEITLRPAIGGSITSTYIVPQSGDSVFEILRNKARSLADALAELDAIQRRGVDAR